MVFVLDNIDIVSYTDDTTTCTSESSVEDSIIGILEEISIKLFHWFALNQISK